MMLILRVAFFTLSLLGSVASFAGILPDLTGQWRNVDDKTGFSKGIVEISKDENGMYSGKIVKIIPRPNYVAPTLCQRCPPPYTDQPIQGLVVLKNMVVNKNNPLEYKGGTVLDPNNGKLYKCKITIHPTDKKLMLRGFVGFEILGRSQIWFRHDPKSDVIPE